MPDIRKRNYALAFISLVLYIFLGYLIQRHESVILISGYSILFLIYAWTYQTIRLDEIKFWLYAAFAFRLSLLISIPTLSDDFYRFIWDGRLLAHGIHPFAQLPAYYLTHPAAGLDQVLYDQLNSKEYFTVYPPVAQYIFLLSTVISPNSIVGSVVVMRIVVLVAEVGTFILLWNLLPRLNVSRKNSLFYALNPLVILELTGNLHFEAFVIFFLLLSIYVLLRSKIFVGGIGFGLAVCAKLIPFIFLPHFLRRLGIRRSLLFYFSVGTTCLLVSLPLLDNAIIEGFQSSLGLYFKRFEFNASVYYLVREYGYWTKGYNIIQTVGWKLALVSTLAILTISFWSFKHTGSEWRSGWRLAKFQFPFSLEDSPAIMMWVLTIYFLFTTTLHPWYLSTLVLLSIFTRYKFAIVWSALIFLTYTGYSQHGFTENLYLVGLEYLLVISYLVYELIWTPKVSD